MNIAKMLQEKKVDFELIPHRETYEAQRMAQELHVSGRAVAKTVLLHVRNRANYVVAVLPAHKAVDLESAAQSLGGDPVELATERELAEQCPDCEMGVLPPFGSQYGMPTMADESLCQDEHIFFEGNTHHESIRMKFEDFVRIEQPQIAKFCC